jgi:multiple sugar transport system permease protein
MSYLDQRHATKFIGLPAIARILVCAAVSFYWMGITTFKPDNQLLSRDGNPFWIIHPTLAHIEKLLFKTEYPQWMWNTVVVSVTSTVFSLFASVLAAYAIETTCASRGRAKRRLGMFLGLPGAAVHSVHPAGHGLWFQLGLFDSRAGR